MKILVIPDIHGSHEWEEAKKISKTEYDYAVFLGDYFDSWENNWPNQGENFRAICDFVREDIQHRKLLLGNHDWSYLSQQADYEKIMAQVYNEAKLEEVNATTNDRTFFLKMEPDGYGLFWDDNEGTPDYGNLLDDSYNLVIHSESDIEISIDILGAEDWLYEFDRQVLYPCERGKITVEEINKTFDWKAFHRQGIAIAVEVKKLLPKNIVLKYSKPFEDRSGIIPNEILIDDDEWYVKNVLEKII